MNRLIVDAPDGVLDAVGEILAKPAAAAPEIPPWDGYAAPRIAEVIVRAWAS